MEYRQHIMHTLQLESDFYDHTYDHYGRDRADPKYIATSLLHERMWTTFQEQTTAMLLYNDHRFTPQQCLQYALKQIQHLIKQHRYTGDHAVQRSVKQQMIQQFILIRRRVKRDIKNILRKE